jgi:GT2 family glycosyltransferase
MSQPLFSVIIISWNRLGELRQCLDHLLPKVTAGIEIRIWDNGSTDGTREWLQAMEKDQAMLRVHYSDTNLGVCISRNQAVAATNAKFLMFLDSDSLLETPGAFEILAHTFQSDTSIGALNFRVLNRRGNIEWPCVRPIADWKDRVFEIVSVDGCGFAIPRETFVAAGGFPEHFDYGAEDHYLVRRCIGLGYRIYYYPRVQVTHLKAESGRKRDQFITLMRNHIWMSLELYPHPWAMLSALRMIAGYFIEARREHGLPEFLQGLKAAISGFRWSRRKPYSWEAWRHLRGVIDEDKRMAASR